MPETVRLEQQGPVALVTLHRPEVLNAINQQMVRELAQLLQTLAEDDSVRAVVLIGAGRCFSAGVDLKEAYTYEPGPDPQGTWRQHLTGLLQVSLQLWNLKKPTIAAVHGFALGGACDWALACDLTIAAEGAKIGEPEIQFGAAAPTLILPWMTGVKKAKELLLTGDTITAAEAERHGLINRVVPADRLLAESIALAGRIANSPAAAVKLTKQAINKIYELQGLMGALDYNLEAAIAIYFSTPADAMEERRKTVSEKGWKAYLAQLKDQ